MQKAILQADGTKTFIRTSTDFAYVIQGDDEARVIKVGRSRDPARRVAGLLSGIPFNAQLVAILGEGTRRERQMKDLLAPDRMRGEWFKPSQALNDYLRSARAENALLIRETIGEDFFRSYIQPAIIEYLNGRLPNSTSCGDFIYRLLHAGYSALGARQGLLLEACPHALTPELLAGYVPLGLDAETPQITIPGLMVADAADLQRAG